MNLNLISADKKSSPPSVRPSSFWKASCHSAVDSKDKFVLTFFLQCRHLVDIWGYYTCAPVYSKQSTLNSTKINLFSQRGSYPSLRVWAMCSRCTWCQWDPQAKISSISKSWRDQGHQQRPQGHRTFKEELLIHRFGESFHLRGGPVSISNCSLRDSLYVPEGGWG